MQKHFQTLEKARPLSLRENMPGKRDTREECRVGLLYNAMPGLQEGMYRDGSPSRIGAVG
jgi:hypothetical protein